MRYSAIRLCSTDFGMKLISIFYVFTALLTCCSSSKCGKSNIINLSQGKIIGSYNNVDQYWSYLGVPYAEFKGRFKEAGDPPSWVGTFRANRSYLSCKQYSPAKNSVEGDEDCFNLNVYTPVAPSTTTAKPLSVIFFIPGGGFYKGSNTDALFKARYFVQKDVVVVTINYRIGAFGFLCLKNDGAPGNMGLKDQLAALRWVKNNIASFGGDPNSVTLFGQSVGASCVDYFISTNAAEGLFHRAIMHSGTSLTPQSFDIEPILTASKAASRLGYNTTDPDELLKIFLNATADEVARISYKNITNDALAAYIFKPCKEDPSSSNTTILTASPHELVQSVRDIAKISVIIGYNNKEGLFWAQNYNRGGLKKLDKDFSSAVPNTFIYKKPEYKALLIDTIKEFYFKNSSIDYNRLIDYFSDVLIMSNVEAKMESFLLNPNISMFSYYFNYDSMRNLRKMESKLRNVTHGATHSDELFYMFDPKVYRYCSPTPSDQIMIDRMTSLWTNFAKTGVPSANIDDTEWPRSENTLKFLNLDKEIQVIDLPNKERINFWKRLHETFLQT